MQEIQPREFLKPHVAQKNNSNQPLQLREVSSNQAVLSEPKMPTDGYWFVPTFLLVITWVVASISESIFGKTVPTKKKSTNHKNSIEPSPKIPCLNCRFFNNDPYLRCVAHPSKALRAEASNCIDYWSLDSNKFASSRVEDD